MLHLHRHCPPVDRIPSRSTYPSEQQETVEGSRRLMVEQQTMKVTTAEWRILGVAYPVTVNNRRHNMPGRVELLPDGQHTVQPKEECFWMFEPGLQVISVDILLTSIDCELSFQVGRIPNTYTTPG